MRKEKSFAGIVGVLLQPKQNLLSNLKTQARLKKRKLKPY
jgi:hypothetical protein